MTDDRNSGASPLPTFAELGISAPIVERLTADGITEPFPVQALTIPDALDGRDVCGKAQTGSGKTLAFGLPIVQATSRAQSRCSPKALILVPTRELASQIVRAIGPLARSRKLRTDAFFGGVPIQRHRRSLQSGVDIVVATPGRLNDLLNRRDISLSDIETVVLDEADQMADMGFMPQVRQILDRVDGTPQTMLFSATLDGEVDKLVKRYQHDPVYHEIETQADTADAMTHRFVGVQPDDKLEIMADIAAGPERTLIFVRTQRRADRIAKQLTRLGVPAAAMHGGLQQNKRERILKQFSSSRSSVMVATNIAARGIHVDEVGIVCHFDPPEEAKTYLHRSGRTARAGNSGVVVTLVLSDQVRDVHDLRRKAGVREAIVPMSPGDERLGDLVAWQPPFDERPGQGAPNGGGGQRQGRPNNRNRRPANRGGQRNRQEGGGRGSRPNNGGPRRERNDDRPRGERPRAHANA